MKPKQQQPNHWPWLLVLLALVALVVARRMRHPEPSYASRPLSAWLQDEATSGQRYQTPDEVLSAAGEDLVPFLIEQLESRDSSWSRSFRTAAERLPGPVANGLHPVPPAYEIHAVAARWLGRLGPAAAPAVPALISLLDDPGGVNHAAKALGRIGPAASAAVPGLVRAAVATNGSFFAGRALLLIGGYQSNDLAQLIAHQDPALSLTGEVGDRLLASDTNGAVQLLGTTLREPGTRYAALNLLGVLGPSAAPAVPALTDLLRGEDDTSYRRSAIQTLGAIGPGASNAIPLLEGFRHGDDESTIAAAREALERIRQR